MRLVMLTALVGALLVYGAAPAAAAGYPSNDCDGSGRAVFDGFVGGGHYKLRTTPAPGDPSKTWVCVAVDDGQRHFGGRAVVSTGSGSAAAVDNSWTACQADPAKLAGESGTVTGIPFEVEVEQTPDGGLQVCLMVSNVVAKRVAINPAAVPGASFAPDDAQPYPYAETPSNTTASAACQNAGVGEKQRIFNAQIDQHHVWLYTWEESSTRSNVCWRVSSPLASTHAWPYGGRVVIRTTERPTHVTAGPTQDLTACDQDVLTLNDSGVMVRYHAGGTAPSFVCARIGALSWRLEANPNGDLGVVWVIGDV